MKKSAVLLIIAVLVLAAVQGVGSPNSATILQNEYPFSPDSQSSTASVSGGGSGQTATMFFDRTITGQRLEILNTYGDTATHNAELDLLDYQVSGWKLFSARIETESIMAAAEKEVVGVTYESFEFQIYEFEPLFFSQLAQGFYNQDHDGALMNYSIYYSTDDYDPPVRGNASLVIRSGSSSNLDSAIDITTPVNMTASDTAFSWSTIQGGNASLSANTIYWAVIDGSSLSKAGSPEPSYPTIWWGGENDAGTFGSYQRGPSGWILLPLEALMNYTYIPWNQTSDTPLTYSSVQQVDLKVNSSTITSLNFDISSASENITNISFDTNQSVYFNYNMTLSYVKDTTATASWEITSSAGLVDWSVRVGTSYPSVSGQVAKYLNISKAISWTITGLYESATPTTNHTDYSLLGSIVRCASMTDGTWRLAASSYNHLSSVHTYDSSDDIELINIASILVDVDVNLTILEEDSDPVTTGLANLTVVKGGSVVWFPSNKSVDSGKANYLWDVDSTSSDNGAYTLEVSWANGTDAGYLTKDIAIFYPTSLTPAQSDIDGYTESTIEVRVYFEDTFTPQGLYGSAAEVQYSFNGESNITMDDYNNGTWIASISTAGRNPGSYLVDVYAEGYALQNRSIQVNVNLIHDTEPLTVVWSNTNNITYVETTELTVYYNRVTGSTPIPGATVNVTIGAKNWTLEWDGVSAYKITFNGTDVPPGFGLHSLIIEAWKLGHKAQSDTTQTLDIHEEQTSMTFEWSDGNDITYIESTTLIVNYTMSDGSPVVGATVNVTIAGDPPYVLTFNGETYQYVFDGDASLPGIGIHSLTIEADKHGHVYMNATMVPLTITKEPTTMTFDWSNGNDITYLRSTTLIVNYTMSDGSPVVDAAVNVTIGGNPPYVLTFNGETYQYVFDGDASLPGIGNHSLTIIAGKYGYDYKDALSVQLNISEEPTSLVITWSTGNNITYVEETYLIANYTISDGSPVLDAVVNVTIGAYPPWTLEWHALTQTYRVLFSGSDAPPGLGTHSLIIQADLFGFAQKDNTTQMVFREEVTELVLIWSNGFSITFIEQTILSANYTMENGTAIRNAMVNVSIGGYPPLTMNWHEGSQTYQITFNGFDDPPGFGNHSVVVLADLFGYHEQSNSDYYLEISKEPTSIDISWSDGTNITYVQQTTLSVTYRMNDTTPIPDANVTVTIGLQLLNLTWNPSNQAYEITFNGTYNPPGFGTYNLTIEASKFGFQSQDNDTYRLTIEIEPTTLELSWEISDTISYVGQTVLQANFSMSNGSAVRGAYVNATIGSREWILEWNETSKMYTLVLRGTHPDLGVGVFGVIVHATLFGYDQQVDTNETLTVYDEPTYLEISWSNGYDIGYFDYTFLFVDYLMASNDTTIVNATLSVTIEATTWDMEWNSTAGMYQIRFNGSDSPPGVGVHNLTIQASKFGYVSQTDDTLNLTLPVIPTVLNVIWTNSNNITFVEQTTLMVNYTMFNGTTIQGATVIIKIGLDLFSLILNETTGVYEHTFYGTNDPPGLGSSIAYISAWKSSFEAHINIVDSFTIDEEPTSLIITWSNGDNITYVSETTLSVQYLMSDLTAITDAVLNVTIYGNFQTLIWNSTSQAYEATFRGDDDPPGYGTHTVEIIAWKFGFDAIFDNNQNFTIRLEDTSISFEWSPNNTITFVEHTKIRIYYLMSNGTPIQGATVNITIGFTRWDVVYWNSTSGAYEWSWSGSDSPPGLSGLDGHLLTIRAWKINYVGLTNVSQKLYIFEEPTQIKASWSNGDSITSVQSTTLLVNFTDSYGTVIPNEIVEVTSGAFYRELTWNATSQLYEVTISGFELPLGIHGFTIEGHVLIGYTTAVNSSMSLTILSEQVSISSQFLNGSTITYVGYTILAVNYTMSNGTEIPLATVNVTINGNLWDLKWHSASKTYRIQFNGSDSLPGLGYHQLNISAWRLGFDPQIDSSKFLTIEEETTTLDIYWGAPNYNNVTYFDYTILYVEYKMSDDTVIQGAMVNVTDGTKIWILEWNSTQGAYSLRFNGSDSPPGLGTCSLTVNADKYGFKHLPVSDITLTLSKDPTTLEITWIGENDISYVEQTILSVTYQMSNGSDIVDAIVNATIDDQPWTLIWNETARAYQVLFTGNQSLPGLGSFTVTIQASSSVFVAQTKNTSLIINNDNPTAIPSWSTFTIDWTQSVILSFDFMDSYGSLIEDATTKFVYVDTIEYNLQGDNGTYWIMFNNTFDLGTHDVWANFSKFGYNPVTALSIDFTITNALTDLDIIWSSVVIDYLGQIDLTVNYYYIGDGSSVPQTGVVANITIDDSITYDLTLQGSFWITSFTNANLSLGSHVVDIRAQVYGYEYSESLGIILTVNEVATDVLVVTWVPSNLTIQYTHSLNLSVDYTFSGVDVPDTAIVNVTIDGRIYNLTYTAGIWNVSIPGFEIFEIGVGLQTAIISAWLHGYQFQTNVTVGINVTVAANMFFPTWEPLTLQASYIDTINLTVVYLEDYEPILDATVQLSINGTIHPLTYSDVDEMWHFSIKASDIGLGIWNITVTANKTGYADGWDSQILTISLAQTNLTVIASSPAIYYDESILLSIYYQLLNTSTVPGATPIVTVDSNIQSTSWNIDHWEVTLSGTIMGLGIHSVEIDFDVFGYEPKSNTSEVTVNAIPTSVDVDDVSFIIYPFDSVTVSFTWLDDKNIIGIDGFIPDVIWPDTFSVYDHGNGTYSIEVSNDALHVGPYNLNVTFTRIGYVDGTGFVNIEIIELPIVLSFIDEIEQFENETITISIQIYDGPHATIVDWGEIFIELEGVLYQLIYESSTQVYAVEIWLGDLAPGQYTLNFTATAIDCETEYGEIQLDIVPKISYTLVIEVDDVVQAGQSIQITILASYESGPLEGFQVTVHIIVERGELAPQEFIEEASDLLEFVVPYEATRLTIWAEFEGAIGEWSATSNVVIREVSPGVMDILSFIISLFGDPITLTIIVGGGGGSIAGLILLRRRRGKSRVSTPSITGDITPLSSVPTAPAGEMDILRDEIKKYPVGLTRTQIAKSLDISRSKAGVLIKKLLESDAGFEEVKDGRLRRIRFRD